MSENFAILRIANIANNRTGGMSRTMHLTGDELIRRGHVVEYGFCDEIQARGNHRLHRFTAPYAAAKFIESHLKKRRFDIVEIHEPLAHAYLRQRPHNSNSPACVVFSYGLEERGRQAWLSYNSIKKIKTPLVSRTTTKIVVMQSRSALQNADLIVCSNAQDKSFLESQCGLSASKIVLHFSGVSAFLSGLNPVNAATYRSSILFLGSWITRKGTIDLVKAVALLAQRNQTIQVTVAGSGRSEDDVRSEIPSDLQKHFKIIPQISTEQELSEVCSTHGVFVLPSYFEGQPLALIEAAALGLVPVVTRIAGNADFIKHQQNGLLVEVGDPVGLAGEIQRLIDSPTRCEELSQAARLSALGQTWEASAHNLEEHYSQLLSSRRSRSLHHAFEP